MDHGNGYPMVNLVKILELTTQNREFLKKHLDEVFKLYLGKGVSKMFILTSKFRTYLL
jgi:hypothetical protein